jgi:hypothetical protein
MKTNHPYKRIFTKKVFLLFTVFAMNMLASVAVNATTTTVASVSALQTAINNAAAGDVLILANGTYNNNTLTIGTSNITVKAATPGGVFLNGTNAITISGSNVTFSGFQFTSGTITGYLITVTGSNNTLTQLNFNGYSAQKMIVLNAAGQYNTISYCNFENKPVGASAGNLIHIDPNISFPGYHKIRYCSFQNMPGSGGDNGNECIRISNGATSTYVSRTVVEFNYFSNTGLGDSEAISVKCQENVLRYNTMNTNQKANFCFRNGNNNIAYGNFYINSGGIRVKEANNIYCYNNYFENCGDGSVSAPVKYIYIIPNLNNINFVHNTFLNGTPIELDSATNNTWANNIFKNTINNIFLGSTSGKSFFGNIYNGNLGVSISSGMTNTDPQLMNNTQGSITSTSPAIDAASTNYPAILDIANIDDDPNLLLDINGMTRPASVNLKDVGCVEYNGSGTSTNHPLALTEVGPSYLGGPTIPDAPTATSPQTICGATVASLSATGTNLKWYDTPTAGSQLSSSTAITSGTYYVSQTVNSVESNRTTVTVTVISPAPTAASLLLCNGSTVSNLTATGTALKWYFAATFGSQLASNTVLSTTTYYVSQTVSACESARTAVAVVLYVVPTTIPLLNADGPGNTYELITSVLAPCQGVAAVEAPDMLGGTVDGTHPAFGRHIAEVWDADLVKYVFEFYSHVVEDNDITGGTVRQRVEMKTYGGSPDNLKGILGETVTYKWRFKVPISFQPSSSFTHIHQVKAVDGDDSTPLFTLTPRYGTPNTLQLIYTQDANSSTDTRAEVNLSLFENSWVEAIETIKIGTGITGTYAITIKKVSDGTTLLSYSSNAIQTIRTAATDPATTGQVANSFIRPKWGIYRSLANSTQLRDDSMRFSDISISEIVPPTAALSANPNGTLSVSGVAVAGTTVTVQFPGGTTGTAVAGAGGAYGPIVSGVLLTSGNVVVSYVSNGNTSPETIGQFTALPVVSDQSICTSGTIANLTATGTLVKWYAAASGGSALVTSTALTGTTYYATQTVNTLESARKVVLITIQTTAAPTANNQTFVGSATVANLVATGTAVQWYAATTGGTALATTTALANGTSYYVSQTLNSCESARTAVTVTIQAPTQTITFTLPLKYTNSPDFDPAAVSNNGSAITYTSSNPAVATIVNNRIHIVARGTSNITASSTGAAPVTQQLIVQCSCVLN